MQPDYTPSKEEMDAAMRAFAKIGNRGADSFDPVVEAALAAAGPLILQRERELWEEELRKRMLRDGLIAATDVLLRGLDLLDVKITRLALQAALTAALPTATDGSTDRMCSHCGRDCHKPGCPFYGRTSEEES